MREAEVEAELCDGCQDCIEHCRYDAMDLVRMPPSKRLKVAVNAERCCGCHECEAYCPQHGITMRWIGRTVPAWSAF